MARGLLNAKTIARKGDGKMQQTKMGRHGQRGGMIESSARPRRSLQNVQGEAQDSATERGLELTRAAYSAFARGYEAMRQRQRESAGT
jgi:hypothetical protein